MPRSLGSSLHGQGDATTLNVNVHYLNLHNVANLDNLCGRIDVTHSHLGDVYKTLNVLRRAR